MEVSNGVLQYGAMGVLFFVLVAIGKMGFDFLKANGKRTETQDQWMRDLVRADKEERAAHLDSWQAMVGQDIQTREQMNGTLISLNTTLEQTCQVLDDHRKESREQHTEVMAAIGGARMTRLVGGHTNQTWGGIPELVAEWEPAAWLVMDPSPDWKWASTNLRTRFTWRPHRDNEPDFNNPLTDPKVEARVSVRHSLAWSHNVEGGWWQGTNESAIHSRDAMARFAEFEAERTRLLSIEGLKAIIGCFAVGNPSDLSWWSAFFPALEAAKQYDGLLGLHEYWWETPKDTRFVSPPWTSLRHRMVYNGEPSHNWAGFPSRLKIGCILLEIGADRGVWEPGVVEGWNRVRTPVEYVNDLGEYDAEIIADPYILGACVFCCGNADFQWTGYDIWPKVARILADGANPLYRQWNQPQSDIINLVGRLPVHPTKRYGPMQNAKRTIVHHMGFNYSGDRVSDSIKIIRSIARQKVARGWPGGPYHFYVDKEGRIFQVNDLDVAAYHVGRFNPTSYGVAMMSGNHKRDPTPRMVQGVRQATLVLRKRLKAHKELMKTYCPGDLDSWWWKEIKT